MMEALRWNAAPPPPPAYLQMAAIGAISHCSAQTSDIHLTSFLCEVRIVSWEFSTPEAIGLVLSRGWYIYTYCMEQSHWKAISASEDFHCIHSCLPPHLSLSWASCMQSIPPHPTPWRSIFILSSHLRLGLPGGLFPSGFHIKTLYTPKPKYLAADHGRMRTQWDNTDRTLPCVSLNIMT